MTRALFAAVLLAFTIPLPAARSEEAAGFGLEQVGTLRLPADVEAGGGAPMPLTGVSGLAWLGEDRWVAAIDNSDKLATFRLALGPEGEPTGVSEVAVRPLQHRHDYEDVALCPPHLEAALAATVAAQPPVPPPPWLLLCEEDTPALRVVAFTAGLPPFESRIYLVDSRGAPDVAGVAGELAARPAGGGRHRRQRGHERSDPAGDLPAHQPMTMFDSITLRARSRSSPVSCM